MQSSPSSLSARLESLIRPHLRFLKSEETLDAGQSLGEAGLDSLASIDLLVEIESEFGIMIPDEDLDENTFSSLNSLAALIEDRMAAVA